MARKSYSAVGYSHVLQASLQLENDPALFIQFRKKLRAISQRHFSMAARAAGQKSSAVNSLGANLKKKYPNYFDGKDNEQSLEFALMYCKQYHNRQYDLCVRTQANKDGAGGSRRRRRRSSTAESSPSRRRPVSTPVKAEKLPPSSSTNQDPDTTTTTIKKEKKKKNDPPPTTTKEKKNQQNDPPVTTTTVATEDVDGDSSEQDPPASASAQTVAQPLMERMAANLAFFSNPDAEPEPMKKTTAIRRRSLRGDENIPQQTQSAATAPVAIPRRTTSASAIATTATPATQSVSRFTPYPKPLSKPASTQTQLTSPGCAQRSARGFHASGSMVSQPSSSSSSALSLASSSTPLPLCSSTPKTPSDSPATPSASPAPAPAPAPPAIHGLLGACLPSMLHLLDSFVAFGCTSDEDLLAVSMWSRDQIEVFIDRVAEGGEEGGRTMTPMEKMILLNRFLCYFL